MIKRTLWYACLVLLCCSAGVLVVTATTAGKTTLVSDSKIAVTANPMMDIYLGAVNPNAVAAAPEKEKVTESAMAKSPASPAATDVRQEVKEAVPTAEPEVMSKEEIRVTEQMKAELLQKDASALRKELELAAIAKGLDPNTVSSYTDAELREYTPAASVNRTERVTLNEATVGEGLPSATTVTAEVVEDFAQTRQEEQDAALEAEAAKAAPAPESKVSIFEAYPDFTAAGTSTGTVVTEESAPADDPNVRVEKQAGELIAKDQAGEKLTTAEKEILSAYTRTLPAYTDPRGRDHLDDNGGTTYVYSGATLRVPPGAGTGGGTDTTFAPITVSGSGGPILDVEVEIDSLYHSFLSDCDIFLQSPNGTRCELSTDNGGYEESYYAHLRFDDDAATNINTVSTGPVTGTYHAEGNLSAFDGQSADGNWNLIVYDDSNIDSGYLISWRIQILAMNGLYANDYWTFNIGSPAAGTSYAPNSSVTVTATFMNYGSTQQPCSVKYQFNGGAEVGEVTASLAQYATEVHSFAAQITMPATIGTYELVVWTQLTGEQDFINDTLRRTVNVVYDGFSCTSAIEFTTVGPESLLYNNCTAGDSTPGQPCGTSDEDMVFFMTLADGEQGEFWQTSNAIDSRHTLRWGGTCPGTTVIDCNDDPDEQKFRYVNHTGSNQTAWFVVGGYSSSTACGNFKLAWQRQTTSDYTIPYTSSFEITVSAPTNPHYTTLPNFWSVENTNGDAYTWENYNSGAANGTYCARAYNAASGDNDWLFTPGLQLTASTGYFLDYFRKSYTGSYPESLEVKIGLQNASSAMTQTIFALDTFMTTTWVEKGQAFSVSSTGTYYIGFHSLAMRSYAGCYLDSVRVLAGACSAPTVTANWASGTYSAVLTSTVSGGHGGNVQYQWFTGEGCVDGNQIPYATSSSYTALTTGTYSLRAWRADSVNCANCDSAYALVTSSCTPQTIPYIDNFDDVTATALPTCWLQESADGASPVWATNTTNPLTSPNDAYILGSTAGNNDWLFTEPLSLEGDTTYVFQYWRRAYSATYADCLQIKYGTSPLSGAMIYTIKGPDTCKTSTTYLKKAALFTAPATGTYYIGINSLTKNSSAGTRIDSVYVYKYGSFCGAPTVTVNAVSAQYLATLSAIVSGGAGGPYVYQWYTGLGCTAGNEISGAVNPTYTTGTAGIYSCRVYCGPDSVNCATCDSANVVLTCTTPSTTMYFEGFESTTGTALPTCWTYQDLYYTTVYWRTSTTTPYAGSRDVYMYGYSGTGVADDWMYTSGISLTGGTTYILDYYRRNSTGSYADSLEIMYGTSPINSAMTNALMAADTNKTTTWKRKAASFTPSVTGTYYIGFHCMSRWYSTSAYTYIDNVRVYEYGVSCAAPDCVWVVGGIGADSLVLTANVKGGYGSVDPLYQWYTGLACQDGNEITGATSKTYTALTTGIYSVKAWFYDLTCGTACDSANVEIVNCVGTGLLSEGFESVTTPALPICWRQENLDTYTYTWVTSTSYPHSGTKYATVYGYVSSGAPNDWLFMRGWNLSADTTYVLSFWYRASSASYTHYLEVAMGTTQTATAMTTPLEPQFTVNSTTYAQRFVSITPPSTGTYFIGLHGFSASSQSGYICVDDIQLYASGVCSPPTTVTVNAAEGVDSTKLKATAVGGTGGPYSYQWYTGDTCQTGNEITGATLDSIWIFTSGSYSCKVYIVSPDSCALCDSGYATVIDCDVPLTLPVYQGFEATTGTALPPCWIAEDLNADNRPWTTSTSYPRTGLRSALNTYSSGTATNDWMITRGVALNAGDTVVCDYWYRCYLPSTSYNESLELMAGTSPTYTGMSVIIDTNFTFSNVSTYTLRTNLFIVPSTGTWYFGWHAGYLINQGGVCVDDIFLYPYGECGAPDSVRVAAVTGSIFAKLTANVYGGYGCPVQYQWYTGDTCLAGNEITGATSKDYYALSTGTYSVKAWYCDPDTCAAYDSAYATVTPDPCTAAAYVAENFDGVTAPALPTCWSQENVNNDSYYWKTYTSNYRSAPNCAYISYNTSLPMNDYLYSPKTAMTAGDTFVVKYWYRSYGSTTLPDCMEVKIGNLPAAFAQTTTLKAPWQLLSSTYYMDSLTFIVPTTGDYYIGWHGISRTNAWYIYLDDIQIYKLGVCQPPATVTVNAAVGTMYVKLTATYTGGIGSPTYQWYNGLACADGNEISGETSADFYATGSGVYSCKVSLGAGCTGCDSALATVNPDVCTPVSFFNEGFEGVTTPALPTCWTYQDGGYVSYYWRTTTTTPHAGTYDAYIYGYTTYPADDWMFSPPLLLQGGQEYTLDYWRRNSSGTYSDSLEILYGTIPASMFMTNVVAAFDTNKTTTWKDYVPNFTPSVTDTYYVGFHCMSRNYTSSAYTYIDDVMLYRSDTCAAPTLTVADSSRIGSVTLQAVMAGGLGAPVVYQWYTGGTCDELNRILGANTNSYTTTTSGTFSCRVYRRDSTTCVACDSAIATVLPIPDGWDCDHPIVLTPPASTGDSTQVTGTTVGFQSLFTDSCDYAASSPVVIYQLTLSSCRRLTFSLDTSQTTTGADKHIAVYESGMCGVRAFLCNDDRTYFDVLAWEGANQRPVYSSGSFCGGELPAGTYYIAVNCYGSTSTGPYKLTVYDNGACGCEITCQGGDVAEVTENRYDPSHIIADPDGGCGSSPVSFDAAVCGTTICGVAWNYQRYGSSYQKNRDTDWYVFSITGRKIITARLDAEFPALFAVVDTNGCSGPSVLFGDSNIACGLLTISDTLDAGTYTIAVMPKYWSGNPLPSQYRLSLACSCLVWSVDSVTTILVNADADPVANDMRIRWTSDQSMVDYGNTYTIYYNASLLPFNGPGVNGWTQLTSGITPVAPPATTYYDDLNVVTSAARRFYIVVGSCQ